MICPKCGKENGEANFCEFCGTKMCGSSNVKVPNIDLSKITQAVSNTTKSVVENVKNTSSQITTKSSASKGVENLKEKLVGLKELFDMGLINEDEYNQKRADLVKNSQI